MYEFTAEEMKAHAAYRKAVITQPYTDVINRQRSILSQKEDLINEQSNFVCSPIRERISNGVAEELSKNILLHIYKALELTKYAMSDETIAISIPVSHLRFKVPREVESELIDRYIYQTKKKISFSPISRPSMKGYTTYYRFNIPSLTIDTEKVET